MPSDRDYLMQIAGDMGGMRKGVENLEKGQTELDEKISGIHRNIADLVTTEECEAHRAEMAAVDDDTGQVPVPQNGLLKRLGDNAKAIMAILTLVAFVAGALLLLARFVGKVEVALATDRKQQQKMIKKLVEPVRPVVIQQPIRYVYPDAGPKRRPRYPRRRRPR